MRSECQAVFLFIAELTKSFKPGSGTIEDKIMSGQDDYVKNFIPSINVNEEEDRKDLHEVIWLERLYDELDRYFEIDNDPANRYMAINLGYRDHSFDWVVPIELDAAASMLQYMGLLTGDRRLLEMTNIIGDNLKDPWFVENLSRQKVKKAATPLLYGSSQTCHQLWADNKLEYTLDEVHYFNDQLKNGAFGVANLFKEFIINNANPKPDMHINIWNDNFDISCNRFRRKGDKTIAYKIWDSIEKLYKVVLHTDTVKVPDLEQFRTYFCTLLI